MSEWACRVAEFACAGCDKIWTQGVGSHQKLTTGSGVLSGLICRIGQVAEEKNADGKMNAR